MVHSSQLLHGARQLDAYLDDTYLVDAKTRVLAVGERLGARWVAVERNLFHPQGGGQPADHGWLDDYEVVPVRSVETGLVVAVAPEGGQLPAFFEGQEAQVRVDAAMRLAHAALHTAGHLIEAAGRAQGWSLAGNNHFPGQARIEFTTSNPDARLADPQGRESLAADLLAVVRTAIQDDLLVSSETDDDGRRVVHLGALHSAPCGGTHVRSLGDLAEVAITGLKVKKGRIRVAYTASHGPRR
ncbi:hypothetical protein AB0F91_43440 [Amycolatopsis sp. NPDC023774]|uniref:hypothetical protein n=1 Tax=Amycolatopsis sp. NPDC023774 TaxID=3155015 RepID=UPI003407B9E0